MFDKRLRTFLGEVISSSEEKETLLPNTELRFLFSRATVDYLFPMELYKVVTTETVETSVTDVEIHVSGVRTGRFSALL